MHIERLVEMANDIAANLAADPEVAVEAIASHIHRFWDPRMREQLLGFVVGGGSGLAPEAQAAVLQLASASMN